MTELQDQIKGLSDADFRDLKLWVITTETTRRQQEPAVRAGQQEIITGLQADGKLPKPEYTDAGSVEDVDAVPEWVSPGNDHAKMYPQGAVIRHNDRVWESRTDLNHWEPGGVGVYDTVWRDITPPPTTDEGEVLPQPYEDSRQYQAGEVVDYQGTLYECQQDHYAAPGWTPENAHAMWSTVEPAPSQ